MFALLLCLSRSLSLFMSPCLSFLFSLMFSCLRCLSSQESGWLGSAKHIAPPAPQAPAQQLRTNSTLMRCRCKRCCCQMQVVNHLLLPLQINPDVAALLPVPRPTLKCASARTYCFRRASQCLDKVRPLPVSGQCHSLARKTPRSWEAALTSAGIAR